MKFCFEEDALCRDNGMIENIYCQYLYLKRNSVRLLYIFSKFSQTFCIVTCSHMLVATSHTV